MTIIEIETPFVIVVALLNNLLDYKKNMTPIIPNPKYGINKYRCLEISEFSN